jgi:hypothetical protein
VLVHTERLLEDDDCAPGLAVGRDLVEIHRPVGGHQVHDSRS